jgi:hypothetical protein
MKIARLPLSWKNSLENYFVNFNIRIGFKFNLNAIK